MNRIFSKENNDIYKLDFRFDQEKMVEAYHIAEDRIGFSSGVVNCISITKRVDGSSSNPRGIFWMNNKDYKEVQVEKYVDETKYSKFEELLEDTYFRKVYDDMSRRFVMGRVRILRLGSRKCLSYHRDPEPRIHIPIISNPGSMMIVNNFATHMKADGSAYFMDTTKYHTALNGGEEERIHLVATVLERTDERR